MGKGYQRKTRRSRRKLQDLQNQTVTVAVGEGKASFPMVLPLSPLLAEVAGAIEQTASQAGLLMMKALIDKEVEQIAGPHYTHRTDRSATCWGHDEGHVIFAGRKVALPRPRVRSVAGKEIPLTRYQAFASAAAAGGGRPANSAAGVHARLRGGAGRGLRRLRHPEEFRLAAVEGPQRAATAAVARTAAERTGPVCRAAGRQGIPGFYLDCSLNP